jgi:cobalt-precorrin 5A hydrolase
MAAGIVIRTFCRHLKDKWVDRPVVCVDSHLSCAVPLIGGHHGANEMAEILAHRLDLYPAITTATDAAGRQGLESTAAALRGKIVNRESSKKINLAFLKEDVPVLRLKGPMVVVVDEDVAVLKGEGLVAGIGARKGVSGTEVLDAIDSALLEAGRDREDIGIIATANLKREEKGISEAASALGCGLVYLPKDLLNAQRPTTPSRANDLGLLGVAEPAVLAIAKSLIMPKKAYGRVTVALGK